MTSKGVGVDDFWEILFTHTTFACDEYAQICGGYLYGYLYATIKNGAIANNPKSLLNGL